MTRLNSKAPLFDFKFTDINEVGYIILVEHYIILYLFVLKLLKFSQLEKIRKH